MSNAVVVKEPFELITLAIEKGSDLEKLEKVLHLQREYNKDVARQAYHKAMAAFKSNPPTIEKDKTVSFGAGRAAYKHASLYNVVNKCSSELSKHGLSAAWNTNNQTGGTISVSCRITHELGYAEETTLSANADTSGNKNAIQAVGSTVSYLQRYTLLSLLGLATADQDDDANSANTDPITDQQLGTLRDMMADRDVKEQRFCEWLKVENLEDLPASQFTKAVAALEAKKKK